jgi:hypothetical protein
MKLASPVVNRWQKVPTVQGKAGMLSPLIILKVIIP